MRPTPAPARSLAIWSVTVLAASALGLTGCDGDGAGFQQLELGVEIQPETLDFGTVWGGRSASLPVIVTNTGQAGLQIEEAVLQGSSGPAMASVMRNAALLPAGEQVRFEVRLTANAGTSGLFLSTLRVQVGQLEPLSVPVSAEIRPVPPCDDLNPCTVDSFVDGACAHENLPEGALCDDGNACTVNTVCAAGRCLGEPLTCADQVGCTVDTCDPVLGCVFEPSNSRCDDEDPCTADVCQATVGCTSTPEPPGTVCHFDGCAELGLCVAGACEISPVPDDFPCEDGDPCTEGDTCQQGECTSGEPQEVGPSSPVVLGEGYFDTDLSLGAEWNFGVFAPTTFEEVLAVGRNVAGGLMVVWRGSYHHQETGLPCQPLFQQAIDFDGQPAPSPQPPFPANDAPDEGRAEPPVPVPPPSCRAGVFLSRLQPSAGALPVTTQLTTTAGPAAAVITPAHPFGLDPVLVNEATGRVAVVTANEQGSQVSFRLFDAGGGLEYQVYGAHDLVDNQPIADLALAREGTTAMAVAQGRYRGPGTSCNDDCEDPFLCCTGAVMTAITFPLSPEEATVGVQSLLHVAEHADGNCEAEYLAGARRWWETRDLHLTMTVETGLAELSFRMDPAACGDLTYEVALNPNLSPYFFTFSPAQAGQPLEEHWGISPLALDPAFGLTGVEQMRHEAYSHRAAAVVEIDACDPGDDEDNTGAPVPLPDCTGRNVGWVSLDGAALLQDALIGPLEPSLPAEALPLLVEYQPRLAARVGQQVQLAWRDTTGQLHRIDAPLLDDGYWWEHGVPLKGADGWVAGVASQYFIQDPEDCCAEDGLTEEACACDAVEMEVRRLVAQGFECGLGPEPLEEGCLYDDECGGGAICAHHDEVCLPLDCDLYPDSCTDAAVPPVCGGLCVDIAEQCFDNADPCVAPPDAEVPLCPTGAALANLSCTWTCVDPNTCEAVVPPPAPDAGVVLPDGGPDAGLDDAGAEPPDAGTETVDAGPVSLDAGAPPETIDAGTGAGPDAG